MSLGFFSGFVFNLLLLMLFNISLFFGVFLSLFSKDTYLCYLGYFVSYEKCRRLEPAVASFAGDAGCFLSRLVGTKIDWGFAFATDCRAKYVSLKVRHGPE